MKDQSDIFIIGGGVNGTAIAADAAGRGLSVTLCEKNDLASGTSSACSKLIHGGLRYLEFYEFGLVRSALREREILLRRAPHLISPLEFVLPHTKHTRPAWLIRLGLFFYDHLARRRYLPRSKTLDLHNTLYGASLSPELQRGFSYFDCFVDDARLVIANALSAHHHGAAILTRTTFLSAQRENAVWKIELQDTLSKKIFHHYAKMLINVGGPWVKQIQNKIIATDLTFDIELDKGSHIVVPKIYEGDFAYILQNEDNRVVFAIPFLEKFTLIGTTDVHLSENPETSNITPEEEDYLCKAMNGYFKKSIGKTDIIWSFAGVRCLQASAGGNTSTITRDYKLLIEDKNNAPLLTVIGGKFTTHRTLAEQAVSKLQPYFPSMRGAWTATKPLPGGDFPESNFTDFLQRLKQDFPWLPSDIATHYAKNYGTQAYLFLASANNLSDLGQSFSDVLYEKEVDYLIQHEWARTAEDILWRRTKLGLFFSREEEEKLRKFLGQRGC